MASITFKGSPVATNAVLPAKETPAPDFTLVGTDLQEITLKSLEGSRVVLNIFPSVDTDVCARSVREFNQLAASMEGTQVLAVSKDLPFALKRFCGAEGIENVTAASAFRGDFAKDYGVEMLDGPLAGLCARAVVVIDGKGEVVYTQLVPEIGQEPDYDDVMAALK